MLLTLNRFQAHPTAIIGKLLVNGLFECFTLEGPEVLIPPGVFPVVLTLSPHLQIVTPQILNVPGRTSIRMHPGNSQKDTEGCVLLGESHTDGTLIQSKVAFNNLLKKIQDAIAELEPVQIVIRADGPSLTTGAGAPA